MHENASNLPYYSKKMNPWTYIDFENASNWPNEYEERCIMDNSA